MRTAFVRLVSKQWQNQEKFVYICDTLHMWEWDVRVVDIEAGVTANHLPICVGAAAPRHRSVAAVRPASG
jgi:hypothetical protein